MSKLRNTPSTPRRRRHTALVASSLVAGSLAGLIAACSSDAHDPTAPAAPRAALATYPTLTYPTSTYPTPTYPTTAPGPIGQPNASDTRQWLTSSQLSSMAPTWHTSASDTQAGTRVPELLNCGSAVTAAATSVTVYPSASQQTFMVGRGTTVTIPAGAVTAPLTISATASVAQNGIKYDFQPHGTRFAKAITISTNYQGCALQYSSPLNFFYVNDTGGILQTMPSSDNRSGNTIQAITDHFSGFMVAWS